MTMKMISSTSTTSTSGVMLMVACILAGSPSRMRHLGLVHLRHPELRYLEQAVHQLGRSSVHLNVEILDLAGKVIERDYGRDRDEDTERRRDQGLSNTTRDDTHSPRPGGGDA